jgi:predicted nucleic acid-binding protein
MQRILLDSGPMIALFDQSDQYHKASVEFIRHNRHELITTLASIAETLHLLDFARHAQLDFMTWLNTGGITLENIQMRDFSRIQALLEQYADLPMDFADACLVFLAEKLNISTIATIDRDFDVYRLPKKRPFTVLIKDQF